MRVRVQCYSGYKAEERPLRFSMGEREVAVRTILDRWYGEGHDYFKLVGEDGHTYILRYDRHQDEWDLTHDCAATAPA